MHVTEPGSFIQIDITLIFGGALLLPGKKPEGKPFGVPSELGDYEFGGSGFSLTVSGLGTRLALPRQMAEALLPASSGRTGQTVRCLQVSAYLQYRTKSDSTGLL